MSSTVFVGISLTKPSDIDIIVEALSRQFFVKFCPPGCSPDYTYMQLLRVQADIDPKKLWKSINGIIKECRIIHNGYTGSFLSYYLSSATMNVHCVDSNVMISSVKKE